MTELPTDVVEFLQSVDGDAAASLRAAHGISEPLVPEKTKFVWQLEGQHDENESWRIAELIVGNSKAGGGDRLVTALAEKNGIKTAFKGLVLNCEYDPVLDRVTVLEIA